MERLIDLAARQFGFDRVELRRRNLVPEAAMPYTNPFGMIYDSGDYHRVMERVLELADWQGFPARRAEARRAASAAASASPTTSTPRPARRASGPRSRCYPRAAVEVVVGTVSQGQGHETSFAQLVTEWLGVPLDSVRLVTGDTDRVSVGGGAHSGRALRLASIVMLNASNDHHRKGAAASPSHAAGGRDRRSRIRRAALPRQGHRPLPIGLFEVARAAATRTDLPDELRGPLARRGRRDRRPRELPLRLPRLRGRGRSRDRRPRSSATRGRRCRARDQPADRARPDPWRHRPGRRPGAAGAVPLRPRRRPAARRLVHGLRDAAAPTLPFFDTESAEVPSPDAPARACARPARAAPTPALGVVINAIVDALAEFGVRHIEMPATPERVWRAISAARP